MTAATLSFVVSAVFCVYLAVRWSSRRRPYLGAWAIGFGMFALASLAGLVRQIAGVTELDYKVFYLFGAILNVAWLALGTIYLLTPPRVARWSTWVLVAFTVVGVVAVAASPVDLATAADTGKGFDAVPLPRILAGIGSGIGSLILIGGALWSAWVFVSKRHQGRRAVANVIIAVGVFIAAAGGTAAFTGATGVVEWTNMVAVIVIFSGVLLT
ncbi:MAG: hypothetical protein KGJ98_03335 [Chloroflexota bacterium]|nr:hypothetical protein [Chloroflexota bacterium]MDE3101246.1 hypothetical protein [Chloroflexota bacterium]